MDEETSTRLYQSYVRGAISKQEYQYALQHNGTRPPAAQRQQPFPRSANQSYVRSPQYLPTTFVQVRNQFTNQTYVPQQQQYGRGPCGPCGPCEPCPCPNFCITNYGADLPFVDPDPAVLIGLNNENQTQYLALSSSPTCFMMAFSVPSQTKLTDNTVGVLRRIDPPYSNQFGNAYVHPYNGYTSIPMEQLTSAVTNAVGPCQQGVMLLDIPTPEVVPPLGLSNSTGVGQTSYMIPMQVNPCLLQAPVEQLTAVQRVILGIDLTAQTIFAECRIGPNSCRCIGQFLHAHTRSQNASKGQYSESDGLFIVLAWDVMCVICDTNDHDENDQPITTYVNTLAGTPAEAYPLVVELTGDNLVEYLNGVYVNVNEEFINETARHEVIWTQNPSCSLPNLEEQFVQFCKYYCEKFNPIDFDKQNYVFPYTFIPKNRITEQLIHARFQYKTLLCAIGASTPPLMMSMMLNIPPPPEPSSTEQ